VSYKASPGLFFPTLSLRCFISILSQPFVNEVEFPLPLYQSFAQRLHPIPSFFCVPASECKYLILCTARKSSIPPFFTSSIHMSQRTCLYHLTVTDSCGWDALSLVAVVNPHMFPHEFVLRTPSIEFLCRTGRGVLRPTHLRSLLPVVDHFSTLQQAFFFFHLPRIIISLRKPFRHCFFLQIPWKFSPFLLGCNLPITLEQLLATLKLRALEPVDYSLQVLSLSLKSSLFFLLNDGPMSGLCLMLILSNEFKTYGCSCLSRAIPASSYLILPCQAIA